VDAGCAFDERRLACGRRSRVVLTPDAGVKCRRSICEATVANKPVTGESAKETVKTIACGNVG